MPYKLNPFTGNLDLIRAAGSGDGDVVGAASSTDNAVTRFNGTNGKLIQNSGVTIDDGNNVNIPSGSSYKINGTSLAASDVGAIASTEKAAANGVATLGADSKIPSDQLPQIAITDTFVVASEVAMLALTAQVGDVAVRTDESKSYILQTADATVLAHWVELLFPTSDVTSVNGETGVVVLDYSDVGAQQLDATLTALAALNGDAGIIKQTGADTFIKVAAPSGAIVGATDTQTLTNKRNTRRVVSVTSAAEPAINTDNTDVANFLALADDVTSMTTNLSGTPADGDLLMFRIKASGARSIAWGASFVDHGATPPVAVTDGKTARVLFEWDAVASAWACISAIEQP